MGDGRGAPGLNALMAGVRRMVVVGLGAVLAAAALLALTLLTTRAATPQARAAASSSSPIDLPTSPGDWHGQIDYRALDARLTAMTQDPSMVGLAVAVVEEGRLSFVRGYGVTSVDDGEPVDSETVFRWASLSKTLSGTLSAQLAAEGVLSLSEPVGAFATSLRLPDQAQQSLTLEQLLSQRTGLPKNAYDGRLEDGARPAEIRAAMAGVATVCPPGTCHTYQNLTFDTISEVVADRAHETLPAAVHKRLLQPLGMTSATYGMDGLTRAKTWARPHHGQTQLELSEAYYRTPAAAGVNSSIVDLTAWMRAQMGLRPEILPASILATVQTPRVATAAPYGRSTFGRDLSDAGYGLGMRAFTYQGHRIVGHSGGVSGYRSTMLFDPATRTGIVMLWNSDANLPFRFQGEFFDLAYGLPFTDRLELKSVAPQQAAE